MHRFSQLITNLCGTTRAEEKVVALTRFFGAAPARDAAWALYFLAGQSLRKTAQAAELRRWAAGAAGVPEWLIEESQGVAGDLAETLALIVPDPDAAVLEAAPTLHALIEDRLLPLKDMAEDERRETVLRTWRELDGAGRMIWNQWLGGEFRAAVERTLLVRALAGLAGVGAAEMAHRLLHPWKPTAEDYRQLVAGGDPLRSPGEPYAFLRAEALEGTPEALGPREAWHAEWHWDGIRAQLIRRRGQVLIWSRGEELLTDRLPEIAEAAGTLPEGTVLDGMVLAWRGEGPLPPGPLRQRLGRKRLSAPLLRETPAVFMAFDLLEQGGADLRGEPLDRRRERLEDLAGAAAEAEAIRISELIAGETWAALERRRAAARQRGARGLLLKRRDAPYGAGRAGGPWWKWKCEPHTLHAVLMYAQGAAAGGNGGGEALTFGVWSGGLLVPVAKTLAGLGAEDAGEIEEFVRANTVERFGPVRVVRQELVFELAFEGVESSPRHKAGLSLRQPRIVRWSKKGLPGEADDLEGLRKMIQSGSPEKRQQTI